MYKEILRTINGVEIGGVISFLIFFIFFITMIVYLFTMKKDFREEMKQIPLDQTNKNADHVQ